MDIFAIPQSWNNAFDREKSLVRTQAFWTCFFSTVMALLGVTAIGVALARRQITSSITSPVLIIAVIGIGYVAYRFYTLVEDFRLVMIQAPPEQTVRILSIGRASIRFFYTSMHLIFILGMVVFLAVSQIR